jgi:Tol biopolymer transport system component
MKNFLKTTVSILAFVIGGVIFQISCSNENQTNRAANLTQLNKIIFTKGVSSDQTIWICDVTFNGTNGNAYPRLSPDGQTIFFVAFNNTTNNAGIYSCDISGNNLQVVHNAGQAVLGIGSVN